MPSILFSTSPSTGRKENGRQRGEEVHRKTKETLFAKDVEGEEKVRNEREKPSFLAQITTETHMPTIKKTINIQFQTARHCFIVITLKKHIKSYFTVLLRQN